MKAIKLDIKKDSLIILISVAFIASLCLLFLPLPFSSAAISLFVVLSMYIKFPKSTMAILGIFLLLQDLITYQLGTATFLGMAIKRSEEVIILLAFIVLLLKNIFYREKWKGTNIDIPLSCLISIAILSSVKNHIVPYMLAGFDLFLLLKGFLVFYIFYNLKLNIEDIRKIVKVFFSIALTVFFFGTVDLIAPGPFRNFMHNETFIDYRFGMPSVQSIFIHPGIFGWFVAFFSCFAFAFFLILKKKQYLVFGILFSLGALLSMKFKPIVGLLVALSSAAFIIPGRKKARLLFVLILLSLVLGGMFGTKISMLLEDRLYTFLQSPGLSNQARNVLYSTSFRIAKDFFPFGTGLGTFGGWISALYYSPIYARYGISSVYGLERGGLFIMDTFWPYMIGQFGFIGAICYIWILISFFRNAVKAFNKIQNSFLKAFILGTIMVLTEVIGESIGGHAFLRPPQYFFIFACLGITFSIEKNNEK